MVFEAARYYTLHRGLLISVKDIDKNLRHRSVWLKTREASLRFAELKPAFIFTYLFPLLIIILQDSE